MTEKEFKKNIWSQKEYLIEKCNYFSNDIFFTPKSDNSGTSNDFYIDTKSLKEWAYEISKCYKPFNDDHALLMKDLLEIRNGQYSNGTLYSSSRLIAEMFKSDKNRKKLLKQLELDKYNYENFVWYLEYRLPIFDSGNEHPAQLDLAIINEHDKIFVGVESKMKEIYQNHHNDFKECYRQKLEEIGNGKFEFTKGSKDYPLRLVLKDCKVPEFSNFYYKQQICHCLGMQNLKNNLNNIDKCLFINFVFDIRDIPGYEEENNIKEYFDNEKEIMGIIRTLFDNEIEYKGIKTQKDFID